MRALFDKWGNTRLDASNGAAAGQKLTLKTGLSAEFLLQIISALSSENLTTVEHRIAGIYRLHNHQFELSLIRTNRKVRVNPEGSCYPR
jgi:hypothetical protein